MLILEQQEDMVMGHRHGGAGADTGVTQDSYDKNEWMLRAGVTRDPMNLTFHDLVQMVPCHQRHSLTLCQIPAILGNSFLF